MNIDDCLIVDFLIMSKKVRAPRQKTAGQKLKSDLRSKQRALKHQLKSIDRDLKSLTPKRK